MAEVRPLGPRPGRPALAVLAHQRATPPLSAPFTRTTGFVAEFAAATFDGIRHGARLPALPRLRSAFSQFLFLVEHMLGYLADAILGRPLSNASSPMSGGTQTSCRHPHLVSGHEMHAGQRHGSSDLYSARDRDDALTRPISTV